MKITSVLGHDHTPVGKWTVLYCGHKVPGILPYGPDIACHACDRRCACRDDECADCWLTGSDRDPCDRHAGTCPTCVGDGA